MKFLSQFPFIGLIVAFVFINSCNKENFTSNPEDQPEFSTDTLNFDTVFTTLGSATYSFKIYNRKKDFIKISRIHIVGGANSHFKINVDGIPGHDFSNIELRPEDSIYIFCEVKINPNDPLEKSPFIIQDSIVFITQGISQSVLLLARGQNANYYPSKSNKSNIFIIDLQNTTLIWDDPKPYIVYGVVYIDNGILEIAAGTRVHFFGGITRTKDAMGNTIFYNDGRLIVGSNASLQIKGNKDQPVILQGVRLEPTFQSVSGQWSGIFFDQLSQNNSIHYATIKNNLIGLSFDSLAQADIQNCTFSGNSYFGMSAYASNVTASNCLFYDQGQSSVAIQGGGNYVFEYCTIANFSNDESSCFVSNNFCLDPPFCTEYAKRNLKADFVNCIFTGNNSDEFYIRIDPDASTLFNLKLDHCLLRINELLKPNQYPDFVKDYCDNCFLRQGLDSLFKDISKNNFRPDSLSFLEKRAKPINGIIIDLIGNNRDPMTPDLGCYEYQY
ncbi:MAG: right-handed parallel beta-helix repeat-containing protein [Saprospiraceae bacterium]|nr:right-handed parallel beta-helix repeat-containing protein [Saprospiraceae bacterium]